MLEKLNEIKLKAQEELKNVKTVNDLVSLRVKYLGKKGELTCFKRNGAFPGRTSPGRTSSQ